MDLIYSRIKPYERKTGYSKEKGFDPNRVTQTANFKNDLDLELADSYSLFMLDENLGLKPLNLSSKKEIINDALNNFEKLYPFYSWVTYLRMGHKKK